MIRPRPILAVGSAAPPLSWEHGDARRDLATACRARGALVLFLPLAGAPVCRDDVRAIAAAALELCAPARPLILVSVDRPAHLRRFLDEVGAQSLIACGDPDLSAARDFGVEHVGGFALRASFLIDREARVAAAAHHPIGFVRPIALLREWCAMLR